MSRERPAVLENGPAQVAYAVADVRAAAHRWVGIGAGPFFVFDHIPVTNVRVGGRPGTFDHSSAYGQWGALMVELVEVHDPAPDHLGLHHLAFMVDDLAAAGAALTAKGLPEVLYAETGGGAGFAFHDARNTMGHLVEIYEPTDRLLGFYATVRAAADDWDGTNPVRAGSGRAGAR